MIVLPEGCDDYRTTRKQNGKWVATLFKGEIGHGNAVEILISTFHFTYDGYDTEEEAIKACIERMKKQCPHPTSATAKPAAPQRRSTSNTNKPSRKRSTA